MASYISSTTQLTRKNRLTGSSRYGILEEDRTGVCSCGPLPDAGRRSRRTTLKRIALRNIGGEVRRHLCLICPRKSFLISQPHLRGVEMPIVPIDNLAYPIRVQMKNSSGSGFLLNTHDCCYLVTAKHVLFEKGIELFAGDLKCTALSRDLSQRVVLNVKCDMALEAGVLRKHRSSDVAVIKLGAISDGNLKFGLGVKGEGENLPQVVGLSKDNTRTLEQVGISNDVFHLGYSASLGREAQLDPTYPLLRRGIVAGKTPNKQIVIDCPTYFGNSGGLVLEAEFINFGWSVRGIGLAIEMVPFVEELWSKQFKVQTGVRFENSGYSIVEPMDRVFELLD